jgi:type I restriction enzyme R subunit
MRHLLDMYIRAEDSEVLMDFEELGLIELIVLKMQILHFMKQKIREEVNYLNLVI